MGSTINDELLNLMRKDSKVIEYKNKKYKALGRGGEGNVYSFDTDSNLAIKVFRKNSICYKKPRVLEKEIYLVNFLNELDQISDHVVDILDYEPCVAGKGYYFMELYDGDLQTWVTNATTKGSEADEDSWISMIFQITFAFMYINSVAVLHGDPKPKNIFFTTRNLLDPNSDGKRTYLVDGKGYEIPYNTRFALGDFSKVRIAEFDRDIEKRYAGAAGTPDLYYNLTHATDLYELSRIIYRILVNSIARTMPRQKIFNHVEHFSKIDDNFRESIDNEAKDIDAMQLPNKMKDRMRHRLYIYELVESNYIKIDQIIKLDPNLVLPSKRVLDLLERVADPNETMATLFAEYII